LINCDGYDLQYVVALDKKTGGIRWKSYRGDSAHAYATPLVISTDAGKQLISPGTGRTVAYDADSGEELWWISYNGFSNVPRPVTGHGLVYVTSGFFKPELFAIRPDGRGDVTRTHVEWKYSKGVSLTPSPVIIGNELYMISDNGIATCLDARTGEELWKERLEGGYSASPVYAGGRIYFLNEEALTTVIQPWAGVRETGRESSRRPHAGVDRTCPRRDFPAHRHASLPYRGRQVSVACSPSGGRARWNAGLRHSFW